MFMNYANDEENHKHNNEKYWIIEKEVKLHAHTHTHTIFCEYLK